MVDFFLTNMQMWIIVMFFFGPWFWRHPFTAEDPQVSKWCNAKFIQICSDEATNSSTFWMAWGWAHFLQVFVFGWTIPLIVLICSFFNLERTVTQRQMSECVCVNAVVLFVLKPLFSSLPKPPKTSEKKTSVYTPLLMFSFYNTTFSML